MQDMYKDGLIPAFEMNNDKCKTCMLTKITKQPFQNVKRETGILGLIRSDLCDLHATPTLKSKNTLRILVMIRLGFFMFICYILRIRMNH